ncbi:MAG: VTT domain-containing protein [Candidatus Acidiferrales bacterium]
MKLDFLTFLQKQAGKAPASTSHAVRRWFFHLGGPGLILLGIIDSSVIPVPGSMDAMTIVLSAHDKPLWIYYAVMATIGAVFGAFLTFRFARTQGEKAMSKRFSARTIKKVNGIFERWGFSAIAVPALLPPPMPMVPFVIAAGAMKYPTPKFLAAITLGRAVRYTILAYLGAKYGRKIFAVVLAHGWTALYVLIGLGVAGFLLWFLLFRHKKAAFATGGD